MVIIYNHLFFYLHYPLFIMDCFYCIYFTKYIGYFLDYHYKYIIHYFLKFSKIHLKKYCD